MKKPHDGGLGDSPIQAEYHRTMNAIAETLDEMFNGDLRGNHRKTAFVLMVFPFGPGGGEARTNYISNGVSRESMVELFREQADRFEESIRKGKQ